MSKSKRKRVLKTVLTLPGLEQSKSAVLDSLASASSKRSYDHLFANSSTGTARNLASRSSWIWGSCACLTQRFQDEQLRCPFGAAVVHKLDWLFPTKPGKEHNGNSAPLLGRKSARCQSIPWLHLHTAT
jgi:hypothetical protein